MDEFDVIDRYFKPLARSYSGSLNLSDDAAIVSVPKGCELVVTKDAISEGIHFLGSEDPALIAKKLLRVNLSDLAAMGAKPLAYFLALMLPKHTTPDWVQRFAEGLREDQAQYGIHLAGGDTISTNGPASFSLTALGSVTAGQALRRNGAQVGDHLYVSGTLGDSVLGLQLLQAKKRQDGFLVQRYFLPEPRLMLGQKLIGVAHAAMDISDGLAQDLGHICKTSGVGAKLHRQLLPLSEAASEMIATDAMLWNSVIGGGDDYELLFAASAQQQAHIERLAVELVVPITMIGEITAGNGVTIVDENGAVLNIPHRGFRHFS